MKRCLKKLKNFTIPGHTIVLKENLIKINNEKFLMMPEMEIVDQAKSSGFLSEKRFIIIGLLLILFASAALFLKKLVNYKKAKSAWDNKLEKI